VVASDVVETLLLQIFTSDYTPFVSADTICFKLILEESTYEVHNA